MAKKMPTQDEWATACAAYMAEMHATLFGKVRYIATAGEREKAAEDVAEMIVKITKHLPERKKGGG